MCHLLLPIGLKKARVQRVLNFQVKTGVHTPQRPGETDDERKTKAEAALSSSHQQVKILL